jgi:hypothetical protein
LRPRKDVLMVRQVGPMLSHIEPIWSGGLWRQPKLKDPAHPADNPLFTGLRVN